MPWLGLLANTIAKGANRSKINNLVDFLNGNPMIGWGIAGFAMVAMATAAIAKWTGNLEKIIVFSQKYLFGNKPEITEAQRQKAREDLIHILHKQVVKRLEDSLHHKIRIDLRREEQRQRVGKGHLPPIQNVETSDTFIKRSIKFFRGSRPTEPVSDHKSTRELFEQKEIQGRLLILGEPGSGKTNELLVLAKDLLIQAQHSPKKPIPVIFELSEWNSDQEFADWLSQQLLEKFRIPFGISRYWIKHNQLLPLLDGLDELRRVDVSDEITLEEELIEQRIANQIQCVRGINAFLGVFSLSLVVCCRRIEYKALETRGEYLKCLNGAIYLHELNNEQIQDYLHKLNRDSLWEALKKQPELLELAHSPLFLIILMVAYKGQKICSTEALLDEYIHTQLHDLNNQGVYPPGEAPTPEKTHHYLSWLATKLESEGTTEFLIEKLQPSWLDTHRTRRQYRWVFGLSFGLIGWLIFGLIFGLSLGLSLGLSFGLIGWLSGRLNDIKTQEKLSFSWSKVYRSGLSAGLSRGLSLGLGVGLSGGLISEPISGLISGIVFGLIGWLIFGLIGGIKTSETDVRKKINPNQGIKNSLKNGLISGLISGLIGWLISGLIGWLLLGLIGWLYFGLVGWLIGGLSGGLRGGLLAVYKHLFLRRVC